MKQLLVAVVLTLAVAFVVKAHASDEALLLIEVDVATVNDVTLDPGDFRGVGVSVWVRNMLTGKSYGGFMADRTLGLLEVAEGIYCLESLSIVGSNLQLDLCAEPYFRVVGGRLNNAGRWRIVIDWRSLQWRVWGRFEQLPRVLERAKKQFPEHFKPAQ